MTDTALSLDTGIRLAEVVSIIGGIAFGSVRIGRLSGRFEVLITQQGKEITELRNHIAPIFEVTTALAVQRVELAAVQISVAEVGQAIVALAKQDERLINQAKRIDRTEQDISDLRRGRGWIQKEFDNEINQRAVRGD